MVVTGFGPMSKTSLVSLCMSWYSHFRQKELKIYDIPTIQTNKFFLRLFYISESLILDLSFLLGFTFIKHLRLFQHYIVFNCFHLDCK